MRSLPTCISSRKLRCRKSFNLRIQKIKINVVSNDNNATDRQYTNSKFSDIEYIIDTIFFLCISSDTNCNVPITSFDAVNCKTLGRELTSLWRCKSMWNWRYYSSDKRFHACLCATWRITRSLSESAVDVRFTGSATCPLCWTRQSRNGHSRKIYADPVYESMTPTCLCFSSRVTTCITNGSLASIDRCFSMANIFSDIRPQSFNKTLIVTFTFHSALRQDSIIIHDYKY